MDKIGAVEVIRMNVGTEIYKKYSFYSDNSPHMSFGIDRRGRIFTYLKDKFIYSRELTDLKYISDKIFEILDR